MASDRAPKWTDEQLAVIKDDSRVTVCIAAAGSGKTQVMTARYRYLVERKGTDPSRVLCCSFGNAGVDAIHERCSAVKGSDRSTFSTLHKLGLELLKTFPEYAGRGVRILSGDELLGRIDLSGNGTLKPSDLARYIQEARERGLRPDSPPADIGRFCSLHDRLRGRDGLFSRAFASYMERLSELHSEGYVDMADLIILPVTRLQADSDLRQKASSMFDAILVDEYQDTDMMQQRLLDLIRRPDTWFTVMGDDDQSIYTWRGANPDMIRMIAEREKVEAKKLGINFRCSKQTIAAAECFVLDSPGRTDKALRALPDADGEMPELRISAGRNREMDDIVALMKQARREGTGPERTRVAFIARTNEMVDTVKERLRREGIPVSEAADTRTVVGKVSTILSWIEGTSSVDALMEMIPDGSCAEAVRALAGTGIRDVKERDGWLAGNCRASEGIAAEVSQLSRPANLAAAIEMTVKIGCFDEGEKTVLRKMYLQLRSAENVRNVLNGLLLSSSDPGNDQVSDGVTVTTIHKAKGLQYDNVILDMTSGVFPRAGTGITPEEERLAYVAFTRAKGRLFVVADGSRGVSSLLTERMDPSKMKGLGPYSRYTGPEEGRKTSRNGMHGTIEMPASWTELSAAGPETEKDRRTFRYAGIGSRKTPEKVLGYMGKIAGILEERGYVLQSGGCYGADKAFISGVSDPGNIRSVFPGDDHFLKRGFTDRGRVGYSSTKEGIASVALHDNVSALSRIPYGKELMERDYYQVMGNPSADMKRVDFVLCYARVMPDGSPYYNSRDDNTGGTGQAIKIARKEGIPVYNLYLPGARERFEAEILGRPDRSRDAGKQGPDRPSMSLS